MAKDDIYQVTTTFVITIDGGDVEYHAGELVDGDDPAYKLVPQHFGELEFKHRKAKPEKAPRKATATEEAGIAATVKAEAAAEKPVEAATAAPGEKRGA